MHQLNIYDEYTITSFDDFKSNYRQIQLLKSFLQSGEENICILSGSLATGKTTLLNIVHKSEEYETIFITSETNYVAELRNFSTKTTIENILKGKKKIAIIDDIHMFEKSFISNVKNIISHNLKIILTIQSKEEAKISELRIQSLKQRVLYIKLNKISFQDCFITVTDLLEKLEITDDQISCDDTMSIIKENNCNLRQTLQYLSKKSDVDSSTSITPNIHDMNVYDLTTYYLKNKIDAKFLSINTTNIVNYLIYENYANIFTIKVKGDSLKVYKDFLKNIILINNDYLQQDYQEAKNVLEHYVMFTNNIMFHKKTNENITLKFTNIFNKLSMQSAFNKKINSNIVETENNCCKPLIRAMCGADKNDFMFKKMCADFK